MTKLLITTLFSAFIGLGQINVEAPVTNVQITKTLEPEDPCRTYALNAMDEEEALFGEYEFIDEWEDAYDWYYRYCAKQQ